MMNDRPTSKTRLEVRVIEDGRAGPALPDQVATEEPMETRLRVAGGRHTVAVTMRTPGSDFELAAGFLYGEGIVARREDVRGIAYCVDPDVDDDQRYNVVTVDLAGEVAPDLHTLERHFFTSSACGVCGKASLEALHARGCPPIPAGDIHVAPDLLYALPERMREAQGLFSSTGGLHAAALFDTAGELLALREDVGRHNAVDKLVGWALLQGRLPLTDSILVVSGRSSYEILQKAVAAGAPVLCSVSAPSSLAVAVAREFGITLVGFLRGRRLNVYTGAERVLVASVGSL